MFPPATIGPPPGPVAEMVQERLGPALKEAALTFPPIGSNITRSNNVRPVANTFKLLIFERPWSVNIGVETTPKSGVSSPRPISAHVYGLKLLYFWKPLKCVFKNSL